MLSYETMGHMPASSIRARVRAEMIDEIKNIARQHLASEGANLSLRAVARDLGVVSSAIYRYFASRDDLLTALILDAYNSLGSAVENADAAVDPDDLAARWLAVCHAVRDWAIAVPHEYASSTAARCPGTRRRRTPCRPRPDRSPCWAASCSAVPSAAPSQARRKRTNCRRLSLTPSR